MQMSIAHFFRYSLFTVQPPQFQFICAEKRNAESVNQNNALDSEFKLLLESGMTVIGSHQVVNVHVLQSKSTNSKCEVEKRREELILQLHCMQHCHLNRKNMLMHQDNEQTDTDRWPKKSTKME